MAGNQLLFSYRYALNNHSLTGYCCKHILHHISIIKGVTSIARIMSAEIKSFTPLSVKGQFHVCQLLLLDHYVAFKIGLVIFQYDFQI